MTNQVANPVTTISPAPSGVAAAHFGALLSLETDCGDTHEALGRTEPGFVLLDVRAPDAYEGGHIEGAINLPHGRLIEPNLSHYPMDTLFVVYCAGPHCNGADKAARRLARLGRPVKKMIGGVTGWIDEGFELVGSTRAIQGRR